MARLTVEASSEDVRLEVAPLLLTFHDTQRSGVAAPRVPYRSTRGITGTADLVMPGYKRLSIPFELNEASHITLALNESQLEIEPVDEGPKPGAVRVTEEPWTPPRWYSADKKDKPGLQPNLGAARQINIIAAASSSSIAIAPVGTGKTFVSVSYDVREGMYRVAPTDARVALLLYYLQAGDHLLAGAVARSLELQTLLENPDRHDSITILAIGYGHAFAGDYRRLRAWNKREGQYIVGADGLILLGECARSCNEYSEAARILAQLSGEAPPAFTCGLELGVRRLISYQRSSSLGRADEHKADGHCELLTQLYADWQEVLLRSNPESVFVTLPADPKLALQPTIERRRSAALRHLVNWLRASPIWARLRATRLEPIQLKEDTVDTKTQSSKQLSRSAVVVAVAAVALWAIVSIILITQRNVGDVAWARMAWIFGSIEAIAFSAAGVLFGTAVSRAQTEKAEERAGQAEARAESLSQDATSGRALGASLQAEEAAKLGVPDEDGSPMDIGGSAEDETIRRHARLARALFGDLV